MISLFRRAICQFVVMMVDECRDEVELCHWQGADVCAPLAVYTANSTVRSFSGMTGDRVEIGRLCMYMIRISYFYEQKKAL